MTPPLWRTAALSSADYARRAARDVPGSVVAEALLEAAGAIDAVLVEHDRIAARVQRDLDAHGDRIRDGMARAQAAGKHIGCPRVAVDVANAAELWAAGLSLKAIAREMGQSRSTVRRRLIEVGIDPGFRSAL